MKIYLSNKMSGIPYFNAPWFDRATEQLLALPGVTEVFNPAEKDRERGFEPLDCPEGSFEEARAVGFELSAALTEDWTYIGRKADCVVVGPDWRISLGAISEVACIQALRKPAYEYAPYLKYYNTPDLIRWVLPPIMELGGSGPATRSVEGVGWI